MSTNLELHSDEALVSVERYPGRPAYRVVTQKRSFDVPLLSSLLPIISAVAARPGPEPGTTRMPDPVYGPVSRNV